MYDYMVVGAGLFGAVFAHEMKKAGRSVLVIDARSHLGGNIYTENMAGINVHKYGPHIFHTNDKAIWDYVQQFAEFNHFTYRPRVNYRGEIYSFPINLMTLYQVWGVKTPVEAFKKLEEVRVPCGQSPNLEEWAISQVGPEIYERFIYHYTKKQWGREPKLLPSFIIRRLPIRLTYDDNYFTDRYQGIPIGGYTQIVEKMLDGIEVKLNEKYSPTVCARKVVYTGPIDEFFNYCYGDLEYRSLRFETEHLEQEDFQGVAAVNYTDETPFTRIIEHKHFEFGKQPTTVITKEFPQEWTRGREAFYPVNDETNNVRYALYQQKAAETENVIFGGRLGTYKYYDMHQVVAQALHAARKELALQQETFGLQSCCGT